MDYSAVNGHLSNAPSRIRTGSTPGFGPGRSSNCLSGQMQKKGFEPSCPFER